MNPMPTPSSIACARRWSFAASRPGAGTGTPGQGPGTPERPRGKGRQGPLHPPLRSSRRGSPSPPHPKGPRPGALPLALRRHEPRPTHHAEDGAEGGLASREAGRNPKEGHSARPEAQLRHPSARTGYRSAVHPEAPGTRLEPHHGALHPCLTPRPVPHRQPPGRRVTAARREAI